MATTAYPVPADEEDRIQELLDYDILDTAPEQTYDDLVELASFVCDTPIAAITLVDEDRQWFKAKRGIDAEQTSRADAFCAHAIMDPDEVMVVEDATQDPRFQDNPFVRNDPEIRFYAGAPLRTPSGHGLGTICVLDTEPRTLTEDQRRALEALRRHVMALLELRRMGRELKRSNSELESFARVVSHDLKNPLSTVLGRLDLLRDGLTSEEAKEEDDLDVEEMLDHADAAIGAAERMEELIRAMLEYARADTGRMKRTEVDVGTIMDELLQDLANPIDAAGAEVVVDGDLPPVQADRTLLRQVFANLVSNAVKFRHPHRPPRIEVRSETVDGGWRFSVEDNGIGIAEKDRDDVLALFKRGDRTRDVAGTGLGLPLCERIVERHGGRLWFDSEEGEGSTFHFTIPAAGGGEGRGERSGGGGEGAGAGRDDDGAGTPA